MFIQNSKTVLYDGQIVHRTNRESRSLCNSIKRANNAQARGGVLLTDVRLLIMVG